MADPMLYATSIEALFTPDAKPIWKEAGSIVVGRALRALTIWTEANIKAHGG